MAISIHPAVTAPSLFLSPLHIPLRQYSIPSPFRDLAHCILLSLLIYSCHNLSTATEKNNCPGFPPCTYAVRLQRFLPLPAKSVSPAFPIRFREQCGIRHDLRTTQFVELDEVSILKERGSKCSPPSWWHAATAWVSSKSPPSRPTNTPADLVVRLIHSPRNRSTKSKRASPICWSPRNNC